MNTVEPVRCAGTRTLRERASERAAAKSERDEGEEGRGEGRGGMATVAPLSHAGPASVVDCTESSCVSPDLVRPNGAHGAAIFNDFVSGHA